MPALALQPTSREWPLPVRRSAPASGGAAPVPEAPGWAATLALGFARRGERTVLARRAHSGPLQVQRAFYPEGPGACHVYLLHPPGGLVQGDCLALDIAAEPGAHALVTTPAAGKLYRSDGPTARQTTVLRVAAGAALEWMPQETIAFAGACVRLGTEVELAAGAAHIGWDVLCLGRPAAGERFVTGEVVQSLNVRREGRLLLSERALYAGGSPMLTAPWGLAGHAACGTLWAVAREPGEMSALCESVQSALSGPSIGETPAGETPAGETALAATTSGVLAAVTVLNDVLVARCLAAHAEPARRWLHSVWTLLRPALLGRAACAPRIWRT